MADEPQDQLKDEHHDYDGIQEYDNNLPRWWLGLFALTVVWAIWYIPFYHAGGAKLGADRLRDENAAAAAERAKAASAGGGPLGEEALRAIAGQPARVAHGKELWTKATCVACHAADGTGMVGPNLRDRFWISGNQMTDIVKVISDGGRTGKGMNPYKASWSADDIHDLAAYIVALNREGLKPGKKPAADEKDTPLEY
jgi:cytochrome c oxidase cbb3-type subunit 3